MSIGRTLAVALTGLEGTLVEVEAEVSAGLPSFALVGLPDSSTLQARERVRGAAGQIGSPLASRRITVNLVPAYLAKRGSGFDLAIAIAVLAAHEVVRAASVSRVVHLGELGLDGRLRPVPGILPSLLAARREGATTAVVPHANAAEAALVEGLDIVTAEDLAEVVRRHGGRASLKVAAPSPLAPPRAVERGQAAAPELDFADVVGQAQARRAAEVAAAGGHHLLLTGPPGAGKTMIAARIPTILPDLSDADALAVSAIHSVAGRFDARDGLVRRPPFESPHHTATPAAVVGGGAGFALPGAISRAHAGVLFLDEAPEFPSRVLEALREPLESGDVTLHRARGVTRYPARFQLVLAANPCPCGRAWGRGEDCSCTPLARRRYLTRLSGPVLDRIDMRIGVGPVDVRREAAAQTPEASAAIARRVARARDRQAARFAHEPWSLNAQIPGPRLRRDLAPARGEQRLLDRAVETGRLTLRGHDRVLRVAWTLADLEGCERPGAEHIGHALALRGGEAR
ncbi:YifB family Mg chelatase-like AAA ATPase [Brachybacterium huguangmaarense]|uniref:YifB family Mg chelatase-like AAA ATPase n=1 Tax=Brachybacterium huguangmaarense TaxID=1652028 RepID=A0ABY6FX51_9MICO|nr:YifB family Mg chelatase-like AAA ATPase [Brachybacterium huguangmaarense]UYG15492.1 YifB family Mg chelatase-like AAA ATPase [Brachybacterium huguangmaarense]